MQAGFWWGNHNAIDYFKGLGRNWRIILKWIFKEQDGIA
jgi:hypothetical protein